MSVDQDFAVRMPGPAPGLEHHLRTGPESARHIGDPDRADAAMRSHLINTGKLLVQQAIPPDGQVGHAHRIWSDIVGCAKDQHAITPATSI
ncbi:hypothetical protein [Nocardia coffeae]|uniref:hypothetical protein n=1 Tax=Nocardia coffeae TaxID=2873381 RepID=UPI001F3D90A9|nr:hypothetical protein [Nocardia coffeae]